MADLAQQLIDDIRGKFESSEFATQVVEPVNEEAIRMVRRNTREGKGLGENTFTDYAPSTAKKKGRSSPVTFRDTETTLESMYGEPSDDKGEITFSHNAEVMWFHQKGEGRNPVREIFPEEQEPNLEELNDFAAEILRRYLSGS